MQNSVRTPDFANLAAVLEKRTPSRPTLYEFYMNDRLYRRLTGAAYHKTNESDWMPSFETLVRFFAAAGYDYASIQATRQSFVPYADSGGDTKTISLNAGHSIADRASFDKFVWLDPEATDMAEFAAIADYLPKGMKIIPYGPCGVLENVISIVGYENLCLMIYDDEQLVYDIFEKVGSVLLRIYERTLEYPFVGALMSNDDWGFNTQTMLSPDDMRRFVFPWHKKIVELAHRHGVYALLHSCGKYADIIGDVIDDMKYDGRHSYEDNIVPVEDAYDALQGKIAVLGGLDVNFMSSASPEEVYRRAKAMLDKTAAKGGYALGTGNSVPDYIPDENFFAMTCAALEYSG